MERDLIELIINSGVAGLLAAVVIYWYRSDSKERISREQERTEEAKLQTTQQREDKLLMVSIVEKNTEAMTELRHAILASNGKQEQG